MRSLSMRVAVICLVASSHAYGQQSNPTTDALKAKYAQRSVDCHKCSIRSSSRRPSALTHCMNDSMVDDLQAVGYPYPDLAQLQVAGGWRIAERIDQKKITWDRGRCGGC